MPTSQHHDLKHPQPVPASDYKNTSRSTLPETDLDKSKTDSKSTHKHTTRKNSYLHLVLRIPLEPNTPRIHSPKIPVLNNPYLRPNAVYYGEQQLGISKYHIRVEFKTIDLMNSLVTGFLQISGLTEDHPEITTCFRGEIINNPLNRYDWGDHNVNKNNKDVVKKYSFLTENSKWGSFKENDLDHWKKLTGSYDFTEQQLRQKLSRIQLGKEDNQFIYMRWKEEFLLPDSRIKQISGASFEGFYYIVLNIGGGKNHNENSTSRHHSHNGLFNSSIIPGSISGLYYHTFSDKFQSLSLRHVEDKGVSNVFEFA